jgi:hypothetical protein
MIDAMRAKLSGLIVCVVVACANQREPVARVSIAPATSTTPPTHQDRGANNAIDDDESRPCCALCIECRSRRARLEVLQNNLKTLHAVTEVWRANHGADCPTVQRLKDDNEINDSWDVDDPWGTPIKITCEDDSTIVYSFGPDLKEGTRDDVRFPPASP